MSAQCPINATTLDVFGQYNQTAKHLIAAYRDGTARVVATAGERYAQFVGARSLVGPDLKARLIGAEQKAGHFVVGAVARVADRADTLVDGIAQRAVAGVELLDEKTAWSRDSAFFNALRSLNMPVAKASLRVAQGMAEASRRLSERAAGGTAPVQRAARTVKAAAKKARTTAVKRARRAAAA
jgi:hypothetical protein